MVLPLRIRQVQGEPPHGVLLRLTARHGEKDVNAFAARYGCELSDILLGRGCDALAALTGIGRVPLASHAPSVDVPSRTVRLAGETLLLNDWTTRRRRWCPRCLAGDRRQATDAGRTTVAACWHRAHWDVRSVDICPEHRVPLEGRCQACGATQAWSGPGVDRCRCGADLAQSRSVAAGEHAALASSYVAGRLGGAPRVPLPLLDDLPLKDAIVALERLGECAALGRLVPKPRRSSATSAAHRELGARIALSWPGSFRTVLDASVASWRDGGGDPRGMIGAYGWVYLWAVRQPPSALVTSLRAELSRHARSEGVVPGEEPLFGEARSPTTSLTEAYRSLRLGYPALRRRLTAGGVMPSGIRRGVRAPVSRAAVEGLRTRLQSELGVSAAALLLGIGRTQAQTLVDRGFIPRIQGGRARRVLRTDVDALVGRLAARACPPLNNTPVIPITKACKSKGVPLAVAVGAVLDGTLAVWGPGPRPGLPGMLVRAAGLGALDDSRGMSVEAAASAMSVHPEVARFLASRGVLGRLPGRRTAGLSRASVEAFGRRYVTGSELARRIRSSPRGLRDRLRTIGIVPAFGPPICRQAIYERSALPAPFLDGSSGT